MADDLANYTRWRAQLHDLGTVEVKHGVKIDIFNLAGDGVGNLTLPQKVARERAAVKRARTRRLIFTFAAVAITVVAVTLSILAYRMRGRLAELSAIPEKSVAVLPFENLSSDPKNALFVIGVQDEVLTRAAKIAALKVIARTSTQRYEPRPADLRTVGKELGVANVLEGTVQIVGQQVRVNVQLIKAATDAHVWAETYDRELTDVFAVESEIAARIASSLRAALNPEEEQRLKVVPTRNADAYEAYLQGREYLFAGVYTPENDRKEKALYERAIQLDPEFALAHVALSTTYSYDALDNGVTPENRTKSRAEADEALRLQPDLGEAHFAKGSYYHRVERNYDAAAREYELALHASPNDGELLRSWGMMERRRGHWRKGLELVQRSVAIDPRNMLAVRGLGDLYLVLRDYAVAEATRRREIDLATTGERAVEARWNLGLVEWVRTGKTQQFHEQFDHLPAEYPQNQRGYRLAELGALERNPDMIIEGIDLTHDERPAVKREKAQAFFHKGDTARAYLVVDPLIATAEASVKENPTEAKYHADLGLYYAYRGRKEDAIREGRRAVELLPESKDAFDGPGMETNLAEIYALVGEADRAVDLLEHVLSIPADLHRRELQVFME